MEKKKKIKITRRETEKGVGDYWFTLRAKEGSYQVAIYNLPSAS